MTDRLDRTVGRRPGGGVTDDRPPPNYRPDYGTGYRLTLEDFTNLITYEPHRSLVEPVMRSLGYSLTVNGNGMGLTTLDGLPVPFADAHREIQADPKKQYNLYQTAMGLWR